MSQSNRFCRESHSSNLLWRDFYIHLIFYINWLPALSDYRVTQPRQPPHYQQFTIQRRPLTTCVWVARLPRRSRLHPRHQACRSWVTFASVWGLFFFVATVDSCLCSLIAPLGHCDFWLLEHGCGRRHRVLFSSSELEWQVCLWPFMTRHVWSEFFSFFKHWDFFCFFNLLHRHCLFSTTVATVVEQENNRGFFFFLIKPFLQNSLLYIVILIGVSIDILSCRHCESNLLSLS